MEKLQHEFHGVITDFKGLTALLTQTDDDFRTKIMHFLKIFNDSTKYLDKDYIQCMFEITLNITKNYIISVKNQFGLAWKFDNIKFK